MYIKETSGNVAMDEGDDKETDDSDNFITICRVGDNQE